MFLFFRIWWAKVLVKSRLTTTDRMDVWIISVALSAQHSDYISLTVLDRSRQMFYTSSFVKCLSYSVYHWLISDHMLMMIHIDHLDYVVDHCIPLLFRFFVILVRHKTLSCIKENVAQHSKQNKIIYYKCIYYFLNLISKRG